MEHLTSLLAAYLIVWYFVFALYIVVLPMAARVFIPAIAGCAGILWARRRFGTPGAAQGILASLPRLGDAPGAQPKSP